MADEQPAPPEDALDVELVHAGVGVDEHRDPALFRQDRLADAVLESEATLNVVTTHVNRIHFVGADG